MKLIAFLFCCFFCGLTSIVGQTTETPHPIDVAQSDCLAKTEYPTTTSMIQCAAVAYEAWDKELNRYYGLLMDVLSVDAQKNLRQAQRAWLAYRNLESDFAGELYYNEMQGTMWRIVANDRNVEFVKHRTLELKDYYEQLTMP